MASAGSGVQQYVKLEDRLTLLAWLNHLLGYRRNRDLLKDTKGAAEGFDASGRSFLYYHMIARGGKVKITPEDLTRYDGNIRSHLDAINRYRADHITLRYFQYLAALYTEIILDRYFGARAQMLAELNAFVMERNATRLAGEAPDDLFAESDLTKLAYWMATGSGKTLILHLNYHQFLHYNTEPLDNILLITPNEGLTDQHLEELATSGIPARSFELSHSTMWGSGSNAVQVIEITKLVEEKRGGGVRVPVEAFEGRNLLFVDEAHKGSGGEVWRGYREALGATGFTFEYSATFGQALSAARNDPLTAEYGKSILFDYSYRYFYEDGYGKDFRILNLRQDSRRDQTETLLLGNLLSFYEQLLVYEQHGDALRPYNLEKPLWVFVGHTVKNPKSRASKDDTRVSSDVLTIVRFLHRLLRERSWAVDVIDNLLHAKSGLASPDGQDLFLGRFTHLRGAGMVPDQMYDDMLARVFHASTSGGLHLADLRGSDGEIGVKAAGANQYFGLVYIGDTSSFRKLVDEDDAGIVVDEDAISDSLFDIINRPDSPVHVLIGAKKFTEGWNSWRVSNMGLLNIGRQEGSQIIQLFGRGVRLRGKGLTLKRSAVLEGEHPRGLRLLETLNIFAIRADYMAQFRDYLEREGVESEPAIELPLFVWANEEYLRRGLVVPRTPESRSFPVECSLLLEPDPAIRVQVDMSVRVETMEGTATGVHTAEVRAGRPRQIPGEGLAWVDWVQAYLDLLAYKERRGMANLVIRPEVPRQILESVPHTVVAEERVVSPRSFAERALLQAAVAAILRRYMDTFYRRRREQWESGNMIYTTVSQDDPNLTFRGHEIREQRSPAYLLRVPRSNEQLVKATQDLMERIDRLYQKENAGLPRLNFERHLYQPLLIEHDGGAHLSPPGLKESEAQFVRDLREYWSTEKDAALAGREVYLLRNLSRGRGVGFFEERGFYPDFILWIVRGTAQRIVFVEPHGMLYAKAYVHDDKARLHERLPALADEIGNRTGRTDISLDSYIISATPYDDLRKRYGDGEWDKQRFAQKHILFRERNDDYDYMKKLLESS